LKVCSRLSAHPRGNRHEGAWSGGVETATRFASSAGGYVITVYAIELSLDAPARSLGALATLLGSNGVNIDRLQCRRTSDACSTVSLLVDLPEGCTPATLAAQCQALGGVEVHCITPYPSAGGLHHDLAAAQQILQHPSQAAEVLAMASLLVFHAQWALIFDPACETVSFSTSPTALLTAGQLGRFRPFDSTHQLPLNEGWSAGQPRTIAAVTPISDRKILVVARATGPQYSQGDLTRLRYLGRLAGRLARPTGNRDILLRPAPAGSAMISTAR
jgi:hypothetical protein